MTKTKNFPHRKKARREKAREQVVCRLQSVEADLAAMQKKAHGVPNASAYAKEISDREGRVDRIRRELAHLNVNLKDGHTAKQRRKADRRAARRRAAA